MMRLLDQLLSSRVFRCLFPVCVFLEALNNAKNQSSAPKAVAPDLRKWGDQMRTGDTVRHSPSGETWFVAWVEPDCGGAGDYLYWAGYPFGCVNAADCELITAATDAQHVGALREIARTSNEHASDLRVRRCREALEKMEVSI